IETNPEQILQHGIVMRQSLARHVSDVMTIDYVRLTLADAGLTDLLPEQPWKLRQKHLSNFTGTIVDAAVGGASMELMAEINRARNNPLSINHAEAAARKGMLTGMRAKTSCWKMPGGPQILLSDSISSKQAKIRFLYTP